MDIKKLKLFAITADTKKISETARLTGYTQAGVSHILKDLETEVGIQLLKRDRYGVHLTPIGSDFLIYVKRLLAENERLEQFVYDLHGIEVGSITIGTFTSISNNWLPHIIKQFNEVHPNIEIYIKEGSTQDIEAWIESMDVDLAFYSLQPGYTHDFIHLYNDPLVAVLPKDYEIDTDYFPVSSLDTAPYILSEKGIDYDVDRALRKIGCKPKVKFTSKEDSTILSMIERDIGISILPELSCVRRKDTLKILPLEPEYHRELGIAIHSMIKATPIVRSFIYAVQAYINELLPPERR